MRREFICHVITDGQHPIEAVILCQPESQTNQAQLVDADEFGPFDSLGDVSQWWLKKVTAHITHYPG